SRLRPGPDLFEPAVDLIRVTPDRDPAVSECARRLTGLRPIGRDIDRNAVVQVDEVAVAMDELYLAGLAAIGVVDGVAVEQLAHHAQIFPELLGGHRVLAH